MHPLITQVVAEQHRFDLRTKADRHRLIRSSRPLRREASDGRS